MPRPRRQNLQIVHGKNRHPTRYLGDAVPTPKGRFGAIYRDDGYGDMAEQLGHHIAPQADGCWLWTGCTNHAGYGPYRTVWDILRGEALRRDSVLHHTCFVKACVNPDHLEPMTNAEHMQLHAELRRQAS